MSTILDDIQNYEFIEPVAGFAPQGGIASIETQPLKLDDDGNLMPATADDARLWSVYVRYDPARSNGFGGVDCVADCANFTGAEKLADLLAALLGVEVVRV